MAHTNETPNYHLPQFVGTDIINPLVDTNGAYSAIDTALKDISDNEVTDAGKILALETTVGDNSDGLVKDVADLQTQNGDSVLTTDAQTLSSAINEIDAHTDANTGNIADNALAITGLQNTVGNANSGLVKDVATLQSNVAALNGNYKIKSYLTALATVTGDGVKTLSQLFDELFAALQVTISNLGDGEIAQCEYLNIDGYTSLRSLYRTYYNKDTVIPADVYFGGNQCLPGSGGAKSYYASVSSSATGHSKLYSTEIAGTSCSFTDHSSDLPTHEITIYGVIYQE